MTSPLVIGISGSQGSGKSTLARYLTSSLSKDTNLLVACVSLDDYYLSKQQRAILATHYHPLLKTRGVPSTHNIALLEEHINAVKQGKVPIDFPQFDKLSDQPSQQVLSINDPIDILIVEGWCLGVKGLTQSQLIGNENELERTFDVKNVWRSFYNNALIKDYQKVWQLFDHLVFLAAPNFDVVRQWRWQQETELVEGDDKSNSMSYQQIEEFVMYFQRLTEQALRELPKEADVTYFLDENRHISKIIGLMGNG